MKKEDLKTKCEDILEILSKTNSKDDIFNFLRDLLTENEILEFSARLEVAKMLYDKVSYKEIEEKTGMSSTTIARVSKYLNGDNKGYSIALNMLKSIYSKHHEAHRLK